jgi:hypothetical protein
MHANLRVMLLNDSPAVHGAQLATVTPGQLVPHQQI